MLELEHHVDLAAGRVGEQHRLVDGDPGISPTVRNAPSRPPKTSAHLGEELVDARPADVERRAVTEGRLGETGPSGRAGSLEMKLTTSMRKPSTPRSSHQRIIE